MRLFEAEEFRDYVRDDDDDVIVNHVAKMSDDEIVSEINDFIDWEEISNIISDAYSHLLHNIENEVYGDDE